MSLHAYRLRPSRPAPAAAAPGDVPGAATGLEAMPVLYPAGPTPHGFLYSQLQSVPFLGAANLWTGTQTFNCPNNTNALVLNSTGTAPNDKHVKMTLAGTWEVGTNLLNDGLDVDYYWTDLTAGLFRMRLDTDGQLSLPGWASVNGVSYNNAVNVVLNMAARPQDGSAPVAGFGVGQQYRLVDGNVDTFTMGALNCVLSNVTPGAHATHLDFYAAAAGVEVLAFTCGGAGGALIATDTNTAAITTVLTLQHVTAATSAGVGVQLVWQGKDAAASDVILCRTAALATATTALAVDSAWVVVPKTGGVNVEVLRVRGGAGMAATVDATAVQGNIGGQVWVRGDLLTTGQNQLHGTALASTSRALVEIGDGVFGGGAGTFAGAASGTYIGINSAAGASRFFEFQVAGVTKANLGPAGNLVLAGSITAQGNLNLFSGAPQAVSGLALVELGAGGFSGGAGGFSGSASGTHLGINAVSGYTGDFVNFQVAGVSLFDVSSAGGLFFAGTFAHHGTLFGAFNTTPAARPTVTGSRGGNAALASLLTGLAALGLVIDSSS